MWEVQIMGHEMGSVLEAGLVSRGTNFTDSPDAEFISEGNHIKVPGQVALGRHGNFFHWGYSGGPKHMTEQGKLVFINAIHYIAKFKGQKPLSPKLNGQMWFNAKVKNNPNKDYRVEYENLVKKIKSINKKYEKEKQDAILKQKKGAKLNEKEKYLLNLKLGEIPSFEDYLRNNEPKLFHKYGLDLKKYNAYYAKSVPYMRANPNNLISSMVDEVAMKFGKSFYDEDFLPYCINALKGEKKKSALVMLKRHTNEKFNSYKEWKKWYKKNKKRLFFSEAGGCKYFINIYK